MFFFLSKALLFLLSPFNWFVAALALYLFWKHERWKTRFKWITIGVFLFFTNTAIMSEAFRLWEIPGTRISEVKKYDVGIVLTGMGEWNNDLEVMSIRRGGDRIWQALTLYHQGKIKKILITGDNGYITDRGLHEAAQFRDVLLSWGIPKQDIITEEKSRNTHENALETKKILDKSYPHYKRFLLITSSKHMRRTFACFHKEGLLCDTFTTDHYTGSKRSYQWDQYFMPNYDNFNGWDTLIKEMVGYITYDLVGYI
jgi:uncharacterized SAM-binding protein YcdF (DUF218 family)